VLLSLNTAAVTSTQNGMKFSLDLETIHSFDLGQFQAILEELLQHLKPRCGYFCGSNVLSVVVEVPNVRYSKYFECMGRN
jgi:hypothetical protein